MHLVVVVQDASHHGGTAATVSDDEDERHDARSARKSRLREIVRRTPLERPTCAKARPDEASADKFEI